MKVRFTRIFQLLILASFVLLSDAAYAVHSISVDNTNGGTRVSDYHATISWSGMTNSCRCGGTTYIYVRNGAFGNCSNSSCWVWGVSQSYNGSTSGSNNFVCGPGYTMRGYVSFWYTGTDHNSGCTCTVSAGLCPAVGCDDRHDLGTGNFGFATHEIYEPINVTATNGTQVDYVDLAWQKNTDVPDAQVSYKIYRDNALIATVAANGTSMAYRDTNLSVGTTYSYYIQTYTSSFGGHTSSPAYVSGSTYSANFQATDGTSYGKTSLSWLNISAWAANDIEVRRNGSQIAVVNKNTTHYNDFDGVPGVKYLYEVAAIDANNRTLPAYKDSGYSRPNGVLSGYVRSPLGTGVQGVTLTATGTVNGNNYTYSAISDAVGYYKINDIFYNTSATYTVVPTKGSDRFSPPSISRVIDEVNYNNSLPDILDTTVFTVSGTVSFNNTVGCPVTGAALYVNGVSQNITTDPAGHYSFIAQQPGSYQIGFKYLNHTFDSTTRNVYISSNTSGIDFKDTKRDTLVIDLKGGCHNQIVDAAAIRVKSMSVSGCFDSVYHSNGFDPITLVIPAQKYRVTVDSAYNPLPDLNITSALAPIDVDLSQRDTIRITTVDSIPHIRAAYDDTITVSPLRVIHHNADTTQTVDTVEHVTVPYRAARFVYHGGLSISLANVDSTCIGYVVEQNIRIPMNIYVKENSSYHNTITQCFQDTGTVRIYDDVSGAGLNYAQLIGGRVIYPLIPGTPNVPDAATSPHRYQKQFNVFVSGAGSTASLDAWMLITGDKTLTATFVSKTPPTPLMVLHDPPGTNSYSSFERDSSFSLDISQSLDTTKNNGGYLGIQVGKCFDLPLGGAIPGAYFNTQISGADGHQGNNTKSQNVTFTASQTISTSGDPRFVGRDADVFIGGTVNTKYAKAFRLTVVGGCQVKVDTLTLWGLDSVTSQFIYTADHIKNTLLVQLADLKQSAPDSMKSYFQDQITMWKQVLTKDSIAIANSNYPQNISFSSGVSYEYTAQQDTTFENSYTYVTTHDVNFSIGLGISDAELIDINAGYNLEFHTEDGHTNNSALSNSAIFTYHLEDQVPGNFFSVGVGKDKSFGSPVFKLFAGTSACPHEEGTQFRDLPVLNISPGSIYNVPANQPASFVAILGNQSESGETRTYNVQLDGSTNLDGATVKIGGQNITQSPASFTIPAFHPVSAALTVEKGPFADYYNDLGIIISSPCDQDISVTVPITVHFQSACSDVSLAMPTDNWLVNSGSHDTMLVAFTAYNASNPNLKEIGLQYRVKNSTQPWLSGPVIPVSALNTPYKTIAFNVSNLPDGNYDIRAYARCLTPANILSYTYSPVLSGVIDRTGFDLFGTPQPSNGILNRGDNISVQFNGNIDCNQLYGHITTTLRRADNGAIVLSSFTCNNNGLIITTNPPSLLDSLNGVVLNASVSNVFDANGNGLNSPVQWSFLVNRAEVYWNPSNLNITNTVGTTGYGMGTLINTATTTKTYTITHWPTWLQPSKLTDAITPNGQDSIRFTVVGPLNPGTYVDTILATAGGFTAKLFVKLDVVLPAPNWSVDPSAYRYNMSITTNFSLTDLNAPLSADKRDKIAVFKGEECRGVASITYDAPSGRYLAFLTAYSNSTAGDSFTFRIWDAMPGTEYQAKERLVFISDGIVGQPQAPYILHAGGVFQTITMNPGWNWFSLNVRSADMSTANVLGHLRADSSAQVKTDNSYAQYTIASGSRGWQGTLGTFTTNKSYMIYLNHADTLHFLGNPVKDTSVMTIAAGWNWIGYPRQSISTAASFLANTNVATGDLLKTQTQFTQYTAGTGWSGGLTDLNPGQGFKLKSTNAFNFVVPPSRSLPSWTADDNTYQQNQTVTAELRFNGVPTLQSHYLVGAFANNVCIGTAQPLYIPSLDIYRVFVTIHGDTANASQDISFKVYDTDNDLEYTPTYDAITVVPDTAVATVQNPYIINVQTATGINALTFTDGYGLLQNVPNPFSKFTTIDYVIPSAQQVTISIYDEAGRLVAELVNGNQAEGRHSVSFEQQDLQSGVYLYQMKSGDFVKTRRMLIIK